MIKNWERDVVTLKINATTNPFGFRKGGAGRKNKFEMLNISHIIYKACWMAVLGGKQLSNGAIIDIMCDLIDQRSLFIATVELDKSKNNSKYMYVDTTNDPYRFRKKYDLVGVCNKKTFYDPTVIFQNQIDGLIKIGIAQELLPLKYVYTCQSIHFCCRF